MAYPPPVGPATHSAASDGRRLPRDPSTRSALRPHFAARSHHRFRTYRRVRYPTGDCLRPPPEPRNRWLSRENPLSIARTTTTPSRLHSHSRRMAKPNRPRRHLSSRLPAAIRTRISTLDRAPWLRWSCCRLRVRLRARRRPG